MSFVDKMFCRKFLRSTFLASSRLSHTLSLTNTYSRETVPVILNGDPVYVGSQPEDIQKKGRRTAKVYCCGPTVYDDCHLGHAFNYIRFDLFRRIMAVYCGIDLIVGMGVTDIDDKIIKKSTELQVDYREVSKKYFNSFVEDMSNLNVSPPHVHLRVTENIAAIIDYIKTLEEKGFAYINEETLDVTFDSSFLKPFSEAVPEASELSRGKKDPRDFVLWKRQKEGEPFFEYESSTKQSIFPGRPGWHVECSAMIHKLFQESYIDFHFGGIDLIVPHNYSESQCCTAFNSDTTAETHDVPPTSWSKHWLHSGHLIMDEEKMSKSLGNTITIKDFLSKKHFNVLRLMCLAHHYRTNLQYDSDLVQRAELLDKQLRHLVHLVDHGIRYSKSAKPLPILEEQVEIAKGAIYSGLADDLDIKKGLSEIENMYRVIRLHEDRPHLPSLIKSKTLLEEWFRSMGLEYNFIPTTASTQVSSKSMVLQHDLIEVLVNFRSNVREEAINLINNGKREEGLKLLSMTDSLRDFFTNHDIPVKDEGSTLSTDRKSSKSQPQKASD